nr:MAG: replication associated protein [Cressdnaviricota sp.]
MNINNFVLNPKNPEKASRVTLKPTGKTTQKSQLYRWSITIPMEKFTKEQLIQHLRGFCKEFYFQGEKGETGYLHWQCCVSLKNKETMKSLLNLVGPYHVEGALDWHKLKAYAGKEETRVEGPFNHNTVFIKTIEYCDLYPWQLRIISIINSPIDNRIIYWIWEEEGNVGKSAFCKYLAVNHQANLISNGTNKDIAYSIKEDPKIVCFLLSRSLEDHVNYGILESIKDGLMFSPKYESNFKIFNAPHIFCFANFRPKVEKLSMDRWIIIHLNNTVENFGNKKKK